MQILCQFLNWVLFSFYCSVVKSLLYILDTRLLSDTRFAKMFSLSGGGHFTFLMMSFAAQKFLILMKSVYLLFLLSLMFLVLHLGNHSLIQCHEDLLFSCRKFIGLVCTFRCLIHFELISIICSWVHVHSVEGRDPFVPALCCADILLPLSGPGILVEN